MPKLNQKGAVLFIFVFVFAAVTIVGGALVYKTVFQATKKLSQNAEVLSVTLESEYNNPFDKDSQYVNPFDEYKNPFDELK